MGAAIWCSVPVIRLPVVWPVTENALELAVKGWMVPVNVNTPLGAVFTIWKPDPSGLPEMVKLAEKFEQPALWPRYCTFP